MGNAIFASQSVSDACRDGTRSLGLAEGKHWQITQKISGSIKNDLSCQRNRNVSSPLVLLSGVTHVAALSAILGTAGSLCTTSHCCCVSSSSQQHLKSQANKTTENITSPSLIQLRFHMSTEWTAHNYLDALLGRLACSDLRWKRETNINAYEERVDLRS